jgi:hypothetical protein
MKGWPLILVIAITVPVLPLAQPHLRIVDPVPTQNCLHSEYGRIPDTTILFKRVLTSVINYFDSHFDFKADTCSVRASLLRIPKFTRGTRKERRRFKKEHAEYYCCLELNIRYYLGYEASFLLNDSLQVVESPSGLKEGAKKIWNFIYLQTAEDSAKKYNDSLYSVPDLSETIIDYNPSLKCFAYHIASPKATQVRNTNGYRKPRLIINASTGQVIKQEQYIFYVHYGGVRWL